MNYGWFVLVPPVIVFALAFLSKNVIFSLWLGIVSGACVAANFSPIPALQLILKHTIGQVSDPSTLWVFCFLAALGALVSFISQAGGTQAYGRLLRKTLHTAKATQLASLSLSEAPFYL